MRFAKEHPEDWEERLEAMIDAAGMKPIELHGRGLEKLEWPTESEAEPKRDA